MGALAPNDEKAFQAFMAFDPNVRAWRNGFQAQYGEPPRMNDPSYDYRAAYMAGNKPQPVPGDSVWHWGSEGKAADHPTEWKQQFMTQFGYDPDQPPPGGMTPEQQQFTTNALYPQFLNYSMRGLF